MISNIEGVAAQTTTSLQGFLKKEVEEQRLPSDIAAILQTVTEAYKPIHRALVHASLDKKSISKIHYNTSGDLQQPLDVLAQDIFTMFFKANKNVYAIISEESQSIIYLDSTGSYIITLDPLDGSTNISVNAPVGTLFSVYKRADKSSGLLQEADILLPGNQQVAAGYLLYSTTIMFVYGTLQGVQGFTYDSEINSFILTHPHITIPAYGNTYAINHSYLSSFPQSIQEYIIHCNQQGCSSRYTGALIADVHRHLIEGGIYLYPPTYKYPSGKLRLMYECNVLAFIVQQAGGLATDGKQSVLDIIPHDLHHRVPFYIGSYNMVQNLLRMIN